MNRLTAAFAIAIVIISLSTVGGTTAVGIEAPSAESGPTEIDSCTTISEPGRYVITQDLTSSRSGDACIQVNASDVVIDGRGHTVLEHADSVTVFVWASDRRLSNVTVRNMDVSNQFLSGSAILYKDVDGGVITNVTPTAPSDIVLIDSSDISVREVTATSSAGVGFSPTMFPGGPAVTVRNTSDAVIAGNNLSGHANPISSAEIEITGGSTNTTVADNRLGGCPTCHEMEEEPLEDLVDHPSRSWLNKSDYSLPEYNGVLVRESVGTTVVNNTIENHVTGIYLVDHETLTDEANETTVIANNTIRSNIAGVRIDIARRPVTIERNDISDNGYGVFVPALEDCVWDAAGIENVGVHRNDIANNRAYGVLNERSFVLNATQNYWGASSGPASADDPDAPFEDPVTGTLADGAGAVVSEDPGDPGVSNVRFDPAREESVTNSSAESAS